VNLCFFRKYKVLAGLISAYSSVGMYPDKKKRVFENFLYFSFEILSEVIDFRMHSEVLCSRSAVDQRIF